MSSVQKSMFPEQLSQSICFARMQSEDLEEVLHIEYSTYPYPWSRGNFLASISSGYETWVIRHASGMLIGYFLLMPALDEAHLLNITVHADYHGLGLGRMLLDKAVVLAKERAVRSILLEVRPSNQRALTVYRRYGFVPIGTRKNYYPASNNTREDAIVMRLAI